MTQPSQGPFGVQTLQSEETNSGQTSVIMSKNGHYLAEIINESRLTVEGQETAHQLAEAEAGANLRLFTSSWDLYEAAKAALAAMKSNSETKARLAITMLLHALARVEGTPEWTQTQPREPGKYLVAWPGKEKPSEGVITPAFPHILMIDGQSHEIKLLPSVTWFAGPLPVLAEGAE